MRWRKIGLAAAGILASSLWFGTASATPLPAVGSLDIDFRTEAWSGANGTLNHTVDGVTASANGEFGCVPFLGCGNTRSLSQSDNQQGGGLGISTFIFDSEADEVDGFNGEVLTITFDIAHSLTGVWITNLFGPDDGPSGDGELVRLVINGGLAQEFGPSDQGDGGYYIDFGGATLVSSIVFSADFGGLFQNNDFSVAGFTAAVPEPATLTLVGAGLLGLGLLRRRRAA